MKFEVLRSIQSQLVDFVESFTSVLGRSERRHCCSVYLSGLLLDGERKSIEPISNRVKGANYQSLQNFVNDSPWDSFELMKAVRCDLLKRFKMSSAVLILDDTSLPKKGKYSVGVGHQYCGALGKLANCQSIVSLQAVGEKLHFPLNARLYLPDSWANDIERMEKSGVPKEFQEFREKWKIALDLIDEITPDCYPEALVTDAGYGFNRLFLAELDKRGIPFVAQTRAETTFWDGNMPIDEHPSPKGIGRRRQCPRPADKRRKAKNARAWAKALFSDSKNVSCLTLDLKTPITVDVCCKTSF